MGSRTGRGSGDPEARTGDGVRNYGRVWGRDRRKRAEDEVEIENWNGNEDESYNEDQSRPERGREQPRTPGERCGLGSED